MIYPVIYYVFVFLFGSAVGSFLNVCVYRLPRDKSIVFPPSACPACGSRISFRDNIPILGWLLLGGRCRSCRGRISLQYPAVELLNGLLTLFLFVKFQLSPTFFVLFLFCSALVVVTFIDLEHQIIPDSISLSGIPVGLAASIILPLLGVEDSPVGIGWRDSLIGIAAGGGSLLIVAYGYHLLTGKEGMGGGDIKLLAMMGAFLGWKAIPFIIFSSSLVGSVVGISLMAARKKDSQLPIPFGPFLAFGAVLYIFFGRELIGWYFGMM